MPAIFILFFRGITNQNLSTVHRNGWVLAGGQRAVYVTTCHVTRLAILLSTARAVRKGATGVLSPMAAW